MSGSCCSCAKMKKFLKMPWSAAFILIACIVALAAALTAQFAFDVQPCVLCLWQRAPYVVALVLSALALSMCRNVRIDCFLMALCVPVFLIGTGIAVFHSGVERHWWAGTDGCVVQPMTQKDDEPDVAALRAQLLHTAVARCDVIDFTFLGLSMANWNVFAFLFMAVFSWVASSRCHKQPEEVRPIACRLRSKKKK